MLLTISALRLLFTSYKKIELLVNQGDTILVTIAKKPAFCIVKVETTVTQTLSSVTVTTPVVTKPPTQAIPPIQTIEAELDSNSFSSVNNTEVSMGITINGPVASGMILDVEVYDDNNNRVFQDYDTIDLPSSANTIPTFSSKWTPSSTGVYYISLGVFKPEVNGAWGDKVFWGDKVGVITVLPNTVTSNPPTIPTPVTPVTTTPQPVISSLYNWAGKQVNNFISKYPMLQPLVDTPTGIWLGSWTNLPSDVTTITNDAKSKGQTPVLIPYNIPNRDSGGYSAGGAQTDDAYKSWIDTLTASITTPCIISLEPDSVAELSTTPGRAALLSYAVTKLKSTGSKVFLDAGGPTWLDAATITNNLLQCNIQEADGIAINVSGFNPTTLCQNFGDQVINLLVVKDITNKQYIVDVSRNGGTPPPAGTWCNPTDVKTGVIPTLTANDPVCYALLALKAAGESDGNSINGNGSQNDPTIPNAGVFWPYYAVAMVSDNWTDFKSKYLKDGVS